MRKSSSHRIAARIFTALVLAGSLISGPVALRGDVVRLKDGRTIIGEMAGEKDGRIIIKTLAGEERIAPEDVLKAEVGYNGFPACVVKADELKERTCGVVLHLAEPGHAIIAFGEGLVSAQDIPEAQILRIDFYKLSEEQRFTSVIGKGTRLEVTLRQSDPKATPLVLKGIAEKVEEDGMTLKLEDGTQKELKEADLQSISFVPLKNDKPPAPSGFWHFVLRLTPGLYQYSRGEYWKGSFFLFGFTGLGAGLGVEYAKARKQERDANTSLAFILFHDTTYETKYRYYQRAQRALGGAMFLLYVGHIFDAFVFRDEGNTAAIVPMIDVRSWDAGRFEPVAGVQFVVRF